MHKGSCDFAVSKHSTQVKYLVIDFSHDENIYDEIEDFCKPFDVGVLVNNVGISVDTLKFVDVVSKNPQILKNITRINIYSVFKVIEKQILKCCPRQIKTFFY